MFEIILERSAAKSLSKLPKDAQLRIQGVIEVLATTPRPPAAKKLIGTERLLWRVRTGNYRIVYEINDGKLIVLVVAIGNRKDIYDRHRL